MRGAMLALFLPISTAQVLYSIFKNVAPDAAVLTEPADMHITMAYLGNIDEIGELRDTYLELARVIADSFTEPVGGMIDGYGRFDHAEGDTIQAVFATCDAQGIELLRAHVRECMTFAGLGNVFKRGFQPHITTMYIPSGSSMPDVQIPLLPVTFPSLVLAWGEERHTFELGSSGTGMFIYKQAGGRWRWVGFSSTAFRDRDGEIIPQASLEEWADWVEKTGDYGPLQWWHVNGLNIGTCDFSAPHGPILIESGEFYDDSQAERAARDPEGFAMSIRYKYNELDQDGVYGRIRIKERSILPVGKESNRLTMFGVSKESDGMITARVRELISRLGSDKSAEELVSLAEAYTAAGDIAGIERKEADGSTPPTEQTQPPTTEPTPTPPSDKITLEALASALVPLLVPTLTEVVGKELRAVMEEIQAKSAEDAKANVTRMGILAKTQLQQQEVLKELLGEMPASQQRGRPSQAADNIRRAPRQKEAGGPDNANELAALAAWLAEPLQ